MRSRGIRASSTPISASRTKEHCVIGLGQFLEVLIGGLMSGVLYSLVALGFVLIFKASGVFNFAQGSMVLLAGLALVRSLDSGRQGLPGLVGDRHRPVVRRGHHGDHGVPGGTLCA